MTDLGTTTPTSNGPYVPSTFEKKLFYYGLPSEPLLVARSSSYVWKKPENAQSYLDSQELVPFGLHHPLRNVWRESASPALEAYFLEMGVSVNMVTPRQVRNAGGGEFLPVIFLHVTPGSLPHERSIELIRHCRQILLEHGFENVRVETRERYPYSDGDRPTGNGEVCLVPKELIPLGRHALHNVWEERVGPAMEAYFLRMGVDVSSMTPLRIGIADSESSPAAVIFVGVTPGSLSHERGMEVAIHCHRILLDHKIDDVHVEIHESDVFSSAAMYLPALPGDPVSIIREPFSTSLGIPISPAKKPNVEGTGSFFFTDSTKPGLLFMVTTRHVLFNPDEEENCLYTFRDGSSAPARNVMLLGEAAFVARVKDIEAAIEGKKNEIVESNRRLAYYEQTEAEEDAFEEYRGKAAAAKPRLAERILEAKEAKEVFETLLKDVRREWKDEANRVIGHVIYSPPISLSNGSDGFTEDWAVIEINPSKISMLNFVGNCIDIGSVDKDVLTPWMYPHSANPHHFTYLDSCRLMCEGTVSDAAMQMPDPRTLDQNNDPTIMVLMNGNTSHISVGRLNTIRSFRRTYFRNIPGAMSREIAILPRTSKSGPFSAKGDSGAMVVDGKGNFCGMLKGGDGTADRFDISFLTSINFLVKRLRECGFKPNIFPKQANLGAEKGVTK